MEAQSVVYARFATSAKLFGSMSDMKSIGLVAGSSCQAGMAPSYRSNGACEANELGNSACGGPSRCLPYSQIAGRYWSALQVEVQHHRGQPALA